jgi:hypothetical protein
VAERPRIDDSVLEAETRRLIERGYTIYRGSNDLLPHPLRRFRPDAFAVGREPNLIIEVVTDDSASADRIRQLREEVEKRPGWELRVLLDRGARARVLDAAPIETINAAIRSAEAVLGSGEPAPSLLLAWGTFEALARRLVPNEFGRPQTPGRLIQILASQGVVDVGEEGLLRRLASVRNAVIHGELSQAASEADVQAFLQILKSLRDQTAEPATAR